MPAGPHLPRCLRPASRELCFYLSRCKVSFLLISTLSLWRMSPREHVNVVPNVGAHVTPSVAQQFLPSTRLPQDPVIRFISKFTTVSTASFPPSEAPSNVTLPVPKASMNLLMSTLPSWWTRQIALTTSKTMYWEWLT